MSKKRGELHCAECGGEILDHQKFCPNCGKPILEGERPAGFWIRVGASFIDGLVFLPLAILGVISILYIKSVQLAVFLCIPGLIYKPLMESVYGATLGKMACGIRVIDENGNNLSLEKAYARFIPWLIVSIISIVSTVIIIPSPAFQAAQNFRTLGELSKHDPTKPFQTLANLFFLVSCVTVAFTYRKRGIHDYIAGSFCVRK